MSDEEYPDADLRKPGDMVGGKVVEAVDKGRVIRLTVETIPGNESSRVYVSVLKHDVSEYGLRPTAS